MTRVSDAVGLRRDDGTAVVEFCHLALLLLVPLVYVMLTVFQVQRAAFGVSAAAREAGRAYASATSAPDARMRADSAIRLSLADHDLDAGATQVDFDDDRYVRGAQVRIVLRYRVPVPLLSALFVGVHPPSVMVTARHTATIDRFRGAADVA